MLSKREVGLRMELEGKGKGKKREEEVASEVAVGKVEVVAVEVMAVGLATALQEAGGSVAGGLGSGLEGIVAGWDDWITDLRSRISDENVLVGGKIVSIMGYEPVLQTGTCTGNTCSR